MNMPDEVVEWFITNGLDAEDLTESELQIARWALKAGYGSGFQQGYDQGSDHGYAEGVRESSCDYCRI